MEDDPFLELQHLEEERRKAAAKTLRIIEPAGLRALGETLFPAAGDPWRDAFFGFIEAHPNTKVYHAKTHDHVQVLYAPEEDKGIWFFANRGVGILQERGRAMMRDLIQGHQG